MFNLCRACPQFRFTLLTLAALEAPLVVPLNGTLYGQDVLFFANDWCGPRPCL
jgi:hypothetical protein